MISRPLIRASNSSLAIGQIGGHVKRGVKHPRGQRTGKTMALVSALPLMDDSELLVLSFMDRSDPHESFDNLPHKGDNAVTAIQFHVLIVSALTKKVNHRRWPVSCGMCLSGHL